MERRAVVTEKAPVTGSPYSQAIICGNLIFVSGQASIDPKTNRAVPGTIEEEVERTLTNIKTILEEAGSSMDKVLKVNVFLADMSDFEKMNSVYRRFFPEPYPARTTVQAKIGGGFKVEIDCIAALQ